MIRDIDAFAVTQLESPPTLDFGELSVTGRAELGVTDACQPDDDLIAHDERRAAIDHRTHGQIRLRRNADLAQQDQVEWRVEGGRDLGGHRNAASWQREDHGLLSPVASERFGEPAACIQSVPKWHRSSQPPDGTRAPRNSRRTDAAPPAHRRETCEDQLLELESATIAARQLAVVICVKTVDLLLGHVCYT